MPVMLGQSDLNLMPMGTLETCPTIVFAILICRSGRPAHNKPVPSSGDYEGGWRHALPSAFGSIPSRGLPMGTIENVRAGTAEK